MSRTERRHCRGSCGVKAPLVLLVGLIFISQYCQCDAVQRLFRRDSKDGHWTYDGKTGQEHWGEMFKSCSGSRQSPVDIDPEEADFNEDLDEFDFNADYDDDMKGAEIKNNGHTVVVTPGAKDDPRTVTDGGLDDTYQFVQLHFHWGSNNAKGSEHTIDGQRFPLEMHAVHRNMKYKTFEAAAKKEDGIAVFAVLYTLDTEDNDEIENIVDMLDEIKFKGQTAKIDTTDVRSLLPDDLMPYYRYRGSLTTPPCSEAVIWTVFSHEVHISEKQLQKFRTLMETEKGSPEEELEDNYRNAQPLHGRVIEISADESGSSAVSFSASPIKFLAAVLAYKFLSNFLPSHNV